MPYRAALSDTRFLMAHVADYPRIAGTSRFAEAGEETAEAILQEAGRLAEEVLAPLQRIGDTTPARLENGIVRTAPGFAAAWRALADGGWIGMAAAPENGGMGLPMTLVTAFHDFASGACLSLQAAPLMAQGQIEALEAHGDESLKALYLPRLVSGEWSATMNLTEPQAGSDVGAIRMKAEPRGDGSYALTGQKIYITWGDCDFTGNVCHLVLARLPGAPEGSRGISLFLVPKFLPEADGTPGARNAVRVVGLERKLGQHGAPTAVMDYAHATGWLVGAPQGGMAAMFTMMNNARLGVAAQGIGVAEAAFQAALAHARDRRQGPAPGTGAIWEHADVKRMLAVMKAETFAARAIALMCAGAIDMGRATGCDTWNSRAALLTPIAKAFGSETGERVATLGIQVHGGMGYVEDTGAAQFLRDVRVAQIYEGTNGIQAMDLVGRKMRDGGAAAFALIDEVEEGAEAARAVAPALAHAVFEAAETLREATEALVAETVETRCAMAADYLRGFARVLGAHAHLAAYRHGEGARQRLATFYIRSLLPEHGPLLSGGARAVLELSTEDLAT